MAEHRITLLNYDAQAGKPAMLTHVARSDYYRVGDVWYSGVTGWLHGFPVDEVRKAGALNLGFAVGDILHAYNAQNVHLESFRVTAIEMCDFDEADYTILGYPDRETFLTSNPLFDVKRAWLVRREIVDAPR